MATITTTTNTTPLQYPANTRIDRDPVTGYLYTIVKASTANTFELWRSINSGASWSLHLSVVRANVAEIGSIFVGADDHLHWCYRTNESSQDRIYWRFARLTNPVWGPEILTGSPANGGTAGLVHTGMDLHVVDSPGPYVYVALVVGTAVGSTIGVTVYGVTINNGTAVSNSNIITGTRQWLQAGTGRITPSVDIEHTGDGKGSTQPNLWIAYGRTALYAVKLSWNGAGWSGPSSATQLTTGLSAQDGIVGRWDGQRWVMAVPNPANTSTVLVVERNRANSATTNRTTPTHPTGVVKNCSISYNAENRDLRVYAVGTSTTVLYYIDFVRTTATWSSWTAVLATAVLGTNGDNYTVRRGSVGNARYDVATAHSGTPNTLTHTAQTLAYTPNTPTWDPTAIGYSNGDAANVSAVLALDWRFVDPDPADQQSAYAISRQIGAGTIAYLRASDSTWQATEQKNVSATTSRSLAASWGASTDANHSYKVKVWDSTDLASGYSDAFVVVPSVKAEPTITSPTEGAVITSDTGTVTWTVSEETAYRAKLLIFGEVLEDSGWVPSFLITSHTFNYRLIDTFGFSITLQTRNAEGLASTVQQVNFTVDFIEPPTPTLVASAQPASGVISVAITNPAPSGGQPAFASQELWRREVGETGNGVRVAASLASGETVGDWRAVSGVNYEYRAHVSGVNGTSRYSAWAS